ncbi:hypothetical protein ACFWD7_58185 [Streptomyces mirabilis]|uniref:hypothetical protein n=1 Tax=Streptomyces mirabilis TaxID=68239 RepID=UPI0036A56E97
MAHPTWITRVRYVSQPLQQTGDLLGYDFDTLSELVKGRCQVEGLLNSGFRVGV